MTPYFTALLVFMVAFSLTLPIVPEASVVLPFAAAVLTNYLHPARRRGPHET